MPLAISKVALILGKVAYILVEKQTKFMMNEVQHGEIRLQKQRMYAKDA